LRKVKTREKDKKETGSAERTCCISSTSTRKPIIRRLMRVNQKSTHLWFFFDRMNAIKKVETAIPAIFNMGINE